MIDFNLQLQLFVYGYNLTILTAVVIFIRKNRAVHSNTTDSLMKTILWTMLMLLSEGASWILAEYSFEPYQTLFFVTTSIGFAFSIYPVLSFFKYLDSRIVKSESMVGKRRYIYNGIGVFYIGLAVVNIKGRFLFDIFSDGTYLRGLGMYMTSSLAIVILLSYVWLNYRKLRTVEGRIVSVLLLFTVLPVLGVLLQIAIYGLPSLWSFFTLLLLFTYVVIERDALMRDPLTGLLNRGHFEERIRYKLKSGQSFSVIMIDLNGFKAINDRYGHQEGDEALIIVSRLLQRSVKRMDMVCRYGGDEFVILLESDDETIGETVKLRITHGLDLLNGKQFKPYLIQMSLGVCHVEKGTSLSEKEILKQVDEKMYANKKSR